MNETKFWNHVAKSDGCWLWIGAKINKGYGHCRFSKKLQLAHRVSWQIHNGTIPDGLCVLHKCDVPNCVRPDHLFLGTISDNSLDMYKKGRKIPIALKGEANPRSKLRNEDVLAIRGHTSISTAELARMFRVSERLIFSIRHRLHWNHI